MSHLISALTWFTCSQEGETRTNNVLVLVVVTFASAEMLRESSDRPSCVLVKHAHLGLGSRPSRFCS